MSTQSTRTPDPGQSSSGRRMPGQLTDVIRSTMNLLNGRDHERELRRALIQEDQIKASYRQVQKALEALPDRTLQWIDTNGLLGSLKEIRRDFRRTVHDSSRSLANELNVLAGRIREAGERFEQTDVSDRAARRVEKAAGRLRAVLKPSWIARVNRTLRNHPLLSMGTALGIGYVLYRGLKD